MALTFPLNPTLGLLYNNFVWDGTKWVTVTGRNGWIQLTQAQYDAIVAPDPGILYVVVG